MGKKFIQIGSNVGNDHVFEYVKNNEIDFGLLIEPNPYSFEMLKENYAGIRNVFFENVAVLQNGVVNLYIPFTNRNYDEASSLNEMHVIKHDHDKKNIHSITVKSMSLESIIDKYNILELNNLFIDAEGSDSDIILSYDFSKCKIDNILFEFKHSDGVNVVGNKLLSVIFYLNSFGYWVKQYDSINIMASKN